MRNLAALRAVIPAPAPKCNTCQEDSDICFDSPGTPCTDDGNECTDDVCDGIGACFNVCNATSNVDSCCSDPTCESYGTCLGYFDDDGDGISDAFDKCPCHPNGIDKGTCVMDVGNVMMSYEEGVDLITCDDDSDCTPTGGYCQKVQGDYNWNGIGDVCEGYADFNESGDVNLADLLDLIICYGKTNFVTYPQCEKYDINDDNRVSAWDFLILSLQYGRDGYDTCGAGIAPAQIAKTGQKICYDELGVEINCLETGQDGEYQKGVIGPST